MRTSPTCALGSARPSNSLVQRCIHLIGRRAAFVNRVVRARNDVTHWDNRSQTSDGVDLYGLAVALNYILDAALLRLLSFEQDEVTQLLSTNRQFQFEVGRAAR